MPLGGDIGEGERRWWLAAVDGEERPISSTAKASSTENAVGRRMGSFGGGVLCVVVVVVVVWIAGARCRGRGGGGCGGRDLPVDAGIGGVDVGGVDVSVSGVDVSVSGVGVVDVGVSTEAETCASSSVSLLVLLPLLLAPFELCANRRAGSAGGSGAADTATGCSPTARELELELGGSGGGGLW